MTSEMGSVTPHHSITPCRVQRLTPRSMVQRSLSTEWQRLVSHVSTTAGTEKPADGNCRRSHEEGEKKKDVFLIGSYI